MQWSRTTEGARRPWLSALLVTLITTVGLLFATHAPAHADGGYYRFIAQHSGKCMDVAGGSTAHMANVHQWQCLNGVRSQRWEARRLDDGAYVIVNQNSGKCLDVAWWATNDGANVIQANCTYADNQRWRIADHPGDGSGWQRIVAKHSGKCLDVAWADTANGANIVQSGCWGGANQTWLVDWYTP